MKIEEQVLSIEQAKHLQELGLDMSDAVLCWDTMLPYDDDEYSVQIIIPELRKDFVAGGGKPKFIPTYTFQEIWNKLPGKIKIENKIYALECSQTSIAYLLSFDTRVIEILHCEYLDENILTLAYNTLCWVLRDGYYKENNQ